jgi:cytidine deaminase/predicted enzyme related to lactoylglutathione lyase
MIYRTLAMFPSEDMNRTAEFYEEKIGFRRVDYMESKEPHICLYRGETEIIVTGITNGASLVPNRELYGYGEDAYFITDEQDALYEEFQKNGVTVVELPHMTDYFNYEFKVRDIDGRDLIFGRKQWNASDDKIWEELYSRAKSLIHDRRLSPLMQAASVAAAIMTKRGNIFSGVCIDTASSLGMCAERNAMANMITNGESEISKVVAVMWDGSVGSPCGACREFMMQLSKNSKGIEILVNLKERKTVWLGDLMPDWWGDKCEE